MVQRTTARVPTEVGGPRRGFGGAQWAPGEYLAVPLLELRHASHERRRDGSEDPLLRWKGERGKGGLAARSSAPSMWSSHAAVSACGSWREACVLRLPRVRVHVRGGGCGVLMLPALKAKMRPVGRSGRSSQGCFCCLSQQLGRKMRPKSRLPQILAKGREGAGGRARLAGV